MVTAVRKPAAPALVEQRRAERHEVNVTRATARGHGEPPAAAALVDLSIYGCRLLVAEASEPGARLWLRLDGGWPIAATVVWADAGRIGCRFDAPIANATMRRFTRGG
ncbi:PilZ domain-containing protein [uncultured Sphingomonas sp.]|uniref:PilZ domain-containing protein n=1 Tax=uncultured Sphingomonas sp. TaxID=158754 RepID=UPI0035C97CA5